MGGFGLSSLGLLLSFCLSLARGQIQFTQSNYNSVFSTANSLNEGLGVCDFENTPAGQYVGYEPFLTETGVLIFEVPVTTSSVTGSSFPGKWGAADSAEALTVSETPGSLGTAEDPVRVRFRGAVSAAAFRWLTSAAMPLTVTAFRQGTPVGSDSIGSSPLGRFPFNVQASGSSSCFDELEFVGNLNGDMGFDDFKAMSTGMANSLGTICDQYGSLYTSYGVQNVPAGSATGPVGFFFDLVVENTGPTTAAQVRINSLAFVTQFSSGSLSVDEVWFRPGPYAGFTNSPGGWAQASSGSTPGSSRTFFSGMDGIPTIPFPLPQERIHLLDSPLILPGPGTYGIHIRLDVLNDPVFWDSPSNPVSNGQVKLVNGERRTTFGFGLQNSNVLPNFGVIYDFVPFPPTTTTTATTGTTATTATTATTGDPTSSSSSSSSSTSASTSSGVSSTSSGTTTTTTSASSSSSSSSSGSGQSSSSTSGSGPSAQSSSASNDGDPDLLWLFIVLGVACCCCIVIAAAVLLVRRRGSQKDESMGSSSEEAEMEEPGSIIAPGDHYHPISSRNTLTVSNDSPSAQDSPGGNYGAWSATSSAPSDETYGAIPKAAREVGIVYAPVNFGSTAASTGNDTPEARYSSTRPVAAAGGNDKWTVSPDDLMWGKELGRGAYGIVYDGLWRRQRVAVKVMTEMTQESLHDFQAEAEVMAGLRPHVNVVQLLGICHDPYSLVMEFVEFGSLDIWRQQNMDVDAGTLAEIGKGIAQGVMHLHLEKIIHRDLAARNVLLSRELVPKVSDFGQARQDTTSNTTKSDTGPLKWMSPEAIMDQKYSVKTDAWAFGVTMCELFSGDEPYPGLRAMTVATKVAAGKMTHEIPPNAPSHVRTAIEQCFLFDEDDRPDFKQILSLLDG